MRESFLIRLFIRNFKGQFLNLSDSNAKTHLVIRLGKFDRLRSLTAEELVPWHKDVREIRH